mmetsp:Transcript_60769/g.96567  ORF Transcript_60769/g.96567 Transcript_60769/m.96567 type:complete len:82 (-) Transcript_60769:171-416(-)
MAESKTNAKATHTQNIYVVMEKHTQFTKKKGLSPENREKKAQKNSHQQNITEWDKQWTRFRHYELCTQMAMVSFFYTNNLQ